MQGPGLCGHLSRAPPRDERDGKGAQHRRAGELRQLDALEVSDDVEGVGLAGEQVDQHRVGHGVAGDPVGEQAQRPQEALRHDRHCRSGWGCHHRRLEGGCGDGCVDVLDEELHEALGPAHGDHEGKVFGLTVRHRGENGHVRPSADGHDGVHRHRPEHLAGEATQLDLAGGRPVGNTVVDQRKAPPRGLGLEDGHAVGVGRTHRVPQRLPAGDRLPGGIAAEVEGRPGRDRPAVVELPHDRAEAASPQRTPAVDAVTDGAGLLQLHREQPLIEVIDARRREPAGGRRCRR